MKYQIYIVKSLIKDWIYVGMTEDLNRRLKHHNSGFNKSTKPYAPFILIHSEEYETSKEARARLQYLKTTSGKRWIRNEWPE